MARKRSTSHGIRRLKCLWTCGEEPEHTVVSQEAAQTYGLRAESRRQAAWIKGPTGITVGLGADYEMLLLMDDLPGCTERVFAQEVKSVEKFCGLPLGTVDEYEVQLGKNQVELLERLCKAQLHRKGASLSERWGETIRRFPAYAESGELVWMNAIRSYRRDVLEITLATSLRLSCSEPSEGCLYAVHVKAGTYPEGPICAWTMEAIGPLEPGDSPDGSGQNPVVEGADMLIGLWDWSRVEEHLRSGWRSIETQVPRKGEQPPKWHLSTCKTSGEEMHLDVCNGTGIKTSEITHEAAAMAGLPQGSTYQVHVKGTRAGSDFHAKGVSVIHCTAARGAMSGELPAGERPDVLLGVEETKRIEDFQGP
jgi:hypothetical protein